MTRAAKIAAIHAERAEHLKAAETLGNRLSELGAALEHVERIRADLVGRVDGTAQTRLASWAVPIGDLAENVARERSALELTLARLGRQGLNIGVVGRARQGKSRFLQSLTGLTSREIPDGSGQFCTGVASVVQHVAGGETHADVYFHSAGSFLNEVVGPYYERLGIGPAPASLAEFSGGSLPPLPGGADAAAESAYGHLSAYHGAFGEYGPLVGAMSPRRVGAGEIRRYVAQDDESGQRKYHAFRAVRRVNIATAFPQADLAGIGVIDLPGLGDTNLGDSKVLLSALRDDVDIVLFLRRPAPEGDGIHDYDVDLYTIARAALPEIPMERRSFLVLNHRASADANLDNLRTCEEFRDQIAGSSIRVARTAIADCSSPEEVAGAFEPVVDYLLAHITELDEMLLAERQRGAAEIYQQARLLAAELAGLGGLAQPSERTFSVFIGLFETAYTGLSVGIEHLVEKYRAERDSPDTHLEDAVNEVLRRAREDTGIISADAIAAARAVHGSYTAAYSHLLDETRAHLSRHFLDLDGALRECVNEMWEDVARVLRDSGQLAPLSERPGRDFLLDIARRIPPGVRPPGDLVDGDGDGDGDDSEVRYALGILTSFDLSYRSFIQHRVRHCLDGMNPDDPMIGFAKDAAPDAEKVQEALETSYAETLFRCQQELGGLLAEPNRAVFGIVEEFRDRVLRSRGIKNEWQAIYEDIRPEIWADRFAALAERAMHLRTWNEAVQRVGTTREA